MGTLIVIRSSDLPGFLEDIDIFLNEKKIGEISRSKSKQFELEPGDYTLQAKINKRTSSVTQFSIKENETRTFKIFGFKFGNLLIPAILLSSFVFHFISDNDSYLKVFIVWMTFLIGILLYRFIWGRATFFRIKSTEK